MQRDRDEPNDSESVGIYENRWDQTDLLLVALMLVNELFSMEFES